MSGKPPSRDSSAPARRARRGTARRAPATHSHAPTPHRPRSPFPLFGFSGLLLALLTLAAGAAQARPWDWRRDTGVQLRWRIGYDSNLFDYSASDIDRFLDGRLPLETSLATYDDLVQEWAVRLRFVSPGIHNRYKTRLYYIAGYRSHWKNRFDDRASLSLPLLKRSVRKVDLVDSSFWIRDSYLRDYYDRDTGRVSATKFSYHYGTAGLRVQLTRSLRAEMRYEGYAVYYNPLFTEYDTKGRGLRGELRWRTSDALSITVELRRRWADNTGYEESTGLAASDSTLDAEYGDGSYGESWLQVGIDWMPDRLVAGREWNLGASLRLRHRYYTSALPLSEDPFHRGREHLQHLLKLSLQTQVFPGIDAVLEAEIEGRRTDSPLDRVIEVKDYDTRRLWLRFSYDLW
ncbi:MAG TPA: hypothetical protein ENI92_00915 [Bacteroidetes bacterium]|nr:hypothetical protein [Bacteroidota bacterium]